MKLLNNSFAGTRSAAFTIVEMLIVIVVIGILAGVVTMTYRGVTQRSTNTQLISDLSNAADQLELDYLNLKTYPSAAPAVADGKGFTVSNGTILAYYPAEGLQSYCLQAYSSKSGTKRYKVTPDSQPTEGLCPNIAPNIMGAVDGTVVNLSWDAVLGAASYQVQWRQNSGSWSTQSAATTSFTQSGRTVGTVYDYQVRAVFNGGVNSEWSATRTLTPFAGPSSISACGNQGYPDQFSWPSQAQSVYPTFYVEDATQNSTEVPNTLSGSGFFTWNNFYDELSDPRPISVSYIDTQGNKSVQRSVSFNGQVYSCNE